MLHNTRTEDATAVGANPLNRGPQPGWMTLNDARERAFTGEIVFEVEPEVRAYLDDGVAYYAERASDAPLGQRLVEAGLVDDGQIERGTVRVGDVEHLGRLFDRDTSVDRDAILVVTESETEALLAQIANESFCTIRSTAYRHHPSGVHRWFVTPIVADADRRFGGVTSLEASVTEDIPGLPVATERPLVDELYIEWDEPIIGGARVAADEPMVEDLDDSLLQAMLDESMTHHNIIEFDELADMDQVAEFSTIEIEYAEVEDFEVEDFDIEKFESFDAPDFDAGSFDVEQLVEEFMGQGSVVEPTVAETVGVEEIDVFDEIAALDEIAARNAIAAEAPAVAAPTDDFFVLWPTDVDGVTESDATDDIWTETDDDAPVTADLDEDQPSVDDLAMTPIETWDEPIVAEVPADVTIAVKRAIAALERITQEQPIVPPILQPSEFDDRHAPVATPSPAPFSGFAPPSLDMSAEAMYARMTAQMQAEVAVEPMAVDEAAPIQPAGSEDSSVWSDHGALSDIASIKFNETPSDPRYGGPNDRSSALRRLIGSLRRKDR